MQLVLEAAAIHETRHRVERSLNYVADLANNMRHKASVNSRELAFLDTTKLSQHAFNIALAIDHGT